MYFQVFRVAKCISHHARFRSTMISGGGRSRPQEDSLNVPLDMIVGTPGRILQHINEGNIVYGDIRYLVILQYGSLSVRRLFSATSLIFCSFYISLAISLPTCFSLIHSSLSFSMSLPSPSVYLFLVQCPSLSIPILLVLPFFLSVALPSSSFSLSQYMNL